MLPLSLLAVPLAALFFLCAHGSSTREITGAKCQIAATPGDYFDCRVVLHADGTVEIFNDSGVNLVTVAATSCEQGISLPGESVSVLSGAGGQVTVQAASFIPPCRSPDLVAEEAEKQQEAPLVENLGEKTREVVTPEVSDHDDETNEQARTLGKGGVVNNDAPDDRYSHRDLFGSSEEDENEQDESERSDEEDDEEDYGEGYEQDYGQDDEEDYGRNDEEDYGQDYERDRGREYENDDSEEGDDPALVHGEKSISSFELGTSHDSRRRKRGKKVKENSFSFGSTEEPKNSFDADSGEAENEAKQSQLHSEPPHLEATSNDEDETERTQSAPLGNVGTGLSAAAMLIAGSEASQIAHEIVGGGQSNDANLGGTLLGAAAAGTVLALGDNAPPTTDDHHSAEENPHVGLGDGSLERATGKDPDAGDIRDKKSSSSSSSEERDDGDRKPVDRANLAEETNVPQTTPPTGNLKDKVVHHEGQQTFEMIEPLDSDEDLSEGEGEGEDKESRAQGGLEERLGSRGKGQEGADTGSRKKTIDFPALNIVVSPADSALATVKGDMVELTARELRLYGAQLRLPANIFSEEALNEISIGVSSVNRVKIVIEITPEGTRVTSSRLELSTSS